MEILDSPVVVLELSKALWNKVKAIGALGNLLKVGEGDEVVRATASVDYVKAEFEEAQREARR